MTDWPDRAPDRYVLRHRTEDKRVYMTIDCKYYVLEWSIDGEPVIKVNPVTEKPYTVWEYEREFCRSRDWIDADRDWRLL